MFTGRWVPLRASQVYTWLKCIGQGAVALFSQGTKVEEWRRVRHYPVILSNDEHVVGHQGGPEMPKGKVSKNGRNMWDHHLFMTFNLAARCFASLGLWEFAWRTYRTRELVWVSCVIPPNKVQPAVAWGVQHPDHAKSQRAASLCVTSTKRKLSHVAAPNLRFASGYFSRAVPREDIFVTNYGLVFV